METLVSRTKAAAPAHRAGPDLRVKELRCDDQGRLEVMFLGPGNGASQPMRARMLCCLFFVVEAPGLKDSCSRLGSDRSDIASTSLQSNSVQRFMRRIGIRWMYTG